MPHAIAHSPRTGDGASDAWDGGPAAPAHERPAATARTVAAAADPPFTATFRDVSDGERFTFNEAARGVLLALLAQALAATLVLFVAVLRLAGSGADGLSLTRGSMGPLLLSAGFGFGTAYALIALNAAVNGSAARLRNTTIVLALALAAAWPLSGFAVPAAPLVTLVIGLAAAYDRVRPPERAAPPVPTGLLLAIVSIALMISSVAGAETHDLQPTAPPRSAGQPPRSHRRAPARRPQKRPAHAPRIAAPAAEEPSPTAPPAAPTLPAAPAPAAVVTAYYKALDARQFDRAWQTLSPAVHAAFGGFDHWKAGFATTLASRPQQIVATSLPGGGFSVRHLLVARDKRRCGPIEQRFQVSWRLVPAADGGWSAASLHAVALGRPAATATCD